MNRLSCHAPSTTGDFRHVVAVLADVVRVLDQLTPPNLSIYTATKSALDAITGVLAKELGSRQIRVNSINPGATAPEGTRAAGVIGVGSDFEKQLIANTPLGRIGQPADIAPIAVFLASDKSGWLTGDLISASGGWRSAAIPEKITVHRRFK